mmetsp:Transcript_78870/g.168992  ORF Transcript_78870/g.168992 Transcript_78870/m.168992 type:complete len:166 (+) Transcript_78870:963-1460(+)
MAFLAKRSMGMTEQTCLRICSQAIQHSASLGLLLEKLASASAQKHQPWHPCAPALSVPRASVVQAAAPMRCPASLRKPGWGQVRAQAFHGCVQVTGVSPAPGLVVGAISPDRQLVLIYAAPSSAYPALVCTASVILKGKQGWADLHWVASAILASGIAVALVMQT